MLFAGDFAWWERAGGLPEYGGIKLCADAKVERFGWNVRAVNLVKIDEIQHERGTVGWAGNSGFMAFNLALQMAPSRIVLVGFDMTIDYGLHWHGRHRGLNNPSERLTRRWRDSLERAAPVAAALGIDVINISPISALTCFRRAVSIEEALSC